MIQQKKKIRTTGGPPRAEANLLRKPERKEPEKTKIQAMGEKGVVEHVYTA